MNKYGFYALVVFVFSIPWQDIVYLPGSSVLSVARLVGLLLIAGGIVSTLRRGTLHLRTPPLTLIITLLFALWATAGTLWNPWNSISGFLYTSAYLQFAIMSVFIWQLCRTREQHMLLMQAFVLGAYVVSSQVVYQFITNPFVPNSVQSMARYTGLGGNPNGVAGMIALALPIAYYLGSFWSRGLMRWLNLLYIPLTLFAIVLTASRGGFIVALVGLLIIPFTFKHLGRSSQIAVSILTVAAAVTLYFTIPEDNFARIAETSSELSEGNVSNRSQIWVAGLELYERSPVVGIGTASFSRAVDSVLGYAIPAHNSFLTVLVEMGIVGFLLFAGNFIVVLIPLLRLPGPEKMLYLWLWLALVVSMLPSNDENAQHVWALLMLMATRKAILLRPFGRTPSASSAEGPTKPAYNA